jgi:hypothetical protein
MIDEKFSKAGRSVWDHVVIGYSKVWHMHTRTLTPVRPHAKTRAFPSPWRCAI